MKEDLVKRVNRFINILLLLVFSLGVWAQNDSVPVSDVPEIEYGMTRKTYEIANIEVEGADSYEDFVLIGFSGLAVGDKIEVPGDQITKAIKRFWKQGLFSSVKIKAKKIEGTKIWLVIELAQRPRISEVRYEGLKKSEREDVEVKAGIRQGSQMTPNLEDHAKTVIKKYFAEKGFHNAEVHVIQQNDVDHPGYVKVLIGVDKKVKTKVGKIYITGNVEDGNVNFGNAQISEQDMHDCDDGNPPVYRYIVREKIPDDAVNVDNITWAEATPEQRAALRELIAKLQEQYPGATVHGHNEFADKACPCFRVRTEL